MAEVAPPGGVASGAAVVGAIPCAVRAADIALSRAVVEGAVWGEEVHPVGGG